MVAVCGLLQLRHESLSVGGERLELSRLLCVLSIELGLFLFYFLEVSLCGVYECIKHHWDPAFGEGGDLSKVLEHLSLSIIELIQSAITTRSALNGDH